MPRHACAVAEPAGASRAHAAQRAVAKAPDAGRGPLRIAEPAGARDDPLAVLLRTAAAKRTRLLQRAWHAQPYSVAASRRTLYVEPQPLNWGGTVREAPHSAHAVAAKPRAVLFETISTIDGFDGLRTRFAALTASALWDTGLSVVLNMAYVPHPAAGAKKPSAATKKVVRSEEAMKQLGLAHAQLMRGWAGPPVNVVLAAWERRERPTSRAGRVPEGELEAIQASVPYTTLRVIAATSAGAGEIDHALRTNHDHVWHKIGDDDMPLMDPNPEGVTPELGAVWRAEQAFGSAGTDIVLTFGYNLTTSGVTPLVRGALSEIYRTEMELRDRIAELDVPMYPSEPTTWYRPLAEGTMSAAWKSSEGVDTGGSGQQLEGAKLAQALTGAGAGFQHFTLHVIMADTSAGRRNTGIVELLDGWWGNGRGDTGAIEPARLESQINKLDQSALRDGEFLDKALASLGYRPTEGAIEGIRALVGEYRRLAVTRACATIGEALVLLRRVAAYSSSIAWEPPHALTGAMPAPKPGSSSSAAGSRGVAPPGATPASLRSGWSSSASGSLPAAVAYALPSSSSSGSSSGASGSLPAAVAYALPSSSSSSLSSGASGSLPAAVAYALPSSSSSGSSSGASGSLPAASAFASASSSSASSSSGASGSLPAAVAYALPSSSSSSLSSGASGSLPAASAFASASSSSASSSSGASGSLPAAPAFASASSSKSGASSSTSSKGPRPAPPRASASSSSSSVRVLPAAPPGAAAAAIPDWAQVPAGVTRQWRWLVRHDLALASGRPPDAEDASTAAAILAAWGIE